MAAFLCATANVGAYSFSEGTSLRQLDIDLMAAAAAGYTEEDLAPVLRQEEELLSQAPPAWTLARLGYYRHRDAVGATLRDELKAVEVHRLDLLQRAASVRLDQVYLGIGQDERYGVDPIELAPLKSHAESVARWLLTAHSPADYRRAYGELGPPLDELGQLRAQYAAQVASVQAEAEALKQRAGGNINALRDVANASLAAGRNDAAWAAYLRYGSLGRAYDLLESNMAKLQGTDYDQVGLAAALEELYRDEVHAALVRKFPHKIILVSLLAQEMWAYEDGRLFLDTIVTTGRPALPTDSGLMRVYGKNSPVHFISPFPHGSVYDYGSVDARYAMWFQPSGEAIHDSWWRSWFGPGSNVGDHGSHGCIGLPYPAIDNLFAWTPLGTPVVVIPGDGTPAASQVAQKTYDDPYWGSGSPPPEA